MGDWLLVTASFLASAVEFVEALTIVLATGIMRGWRSSLAGVAAALIVLAVLVAGLGPALALLPIGVLRLVVGTLLLTFGLQWLRKAILRAGGFVALHDEDAAYRGTVEAAQTEGQRRLHGIDWYAFTLCFKGVLLEGTEVAFIVITFGATAQKLELAAGGAGLALLAVLIAGIVVQAPLSRVPENTLKFVVGVMLSAFGTFWAAEGAGVDWPASDGAIIGLVAAYALLSAGYVSVLRRRRAPASRQAV